MACDWYGVLCVSLTYILITFISYSLFYIELNIFPATNNVHLILFGFIIFMIIWSHLQSIIGNPGYLPKNYRQLDPDLLPLEFTEVIEKITNESASSTNESSIKVSLSVI